MNSSDNKVAIQKFIARRSSAETLASSRGMTFGGAGASLAIILLIAQVGATKTAISWSLGFAAIAFPLWLWLSLALTYDMWLALKLDFNDLHAVKWLPKLQALWFYSTGAITFISIAFLVFGLHTNVGFAFIAASLLGLIFVVVALLAASRRLLHHMAHPSGEGAQNNGA